MDTDMENKLKEVQNKQECIQKAIKRKSRQIDKKRHEISVSKKIEAMKEETKTEVITKRTNEKLRLTNMQKEGERRRRKIQQQIDTVRQTMINDMVKNEKEGDAKLCNPSQPDQKKIEYCDKHYDEDVDYNKACKEPNNFCVMCCNSEFGDMHVEKKTECKSQCEDEKKDGDSPVKPKNEIEGNWVWVPQTAK